MNSYDDGTDVLDREEVADRFESDHRPVVSPDVKTKTSDLPTTAIPREAEVPAVAGEHKKRKLITRKSLLGTLALLLLVFTAAHLLWKHSGSNEWKEVRSDNGIVISTLKTPGEVLLKYKVNVQFESPLSDVVFYMTDINTGSDLGAIDLVRLDHIVSDPVVISYDTYKLDLGMPLGMREVVLFNQYAQNKQTGDTEIHILAAPGTIPMTKGIKRILHMSNHWYLSRVSDGVTDLEVISEMDLLVPYPLANLATADFIYESTDQMRTLLGTEKYQNKSPLFIEN